MRSQKFSMSGTGRKWLSMPGPVLPLRSLVSIANQVTRRKGCTTLLRLVVDAEGLITLPNVV